MKLKETCQKTMRQETAHKFNFDVVESSDVFTQVYDQVSPLERTVGVFFTDTYIQTESCAPPCI